MTTDEHGIARFDAAELAVLEEARTILITAHRHDAVQYAASVQCVDAYNRIGHATKMVALQKPASEVNLG